MDNTRRDKIIAEASQQALDSLQTLIYHLAKLESVRHYRVDSDTCKALHTLAEELVFDTHK